MRASQAHTGDYFAQRAGATGYRERDGELHCTYCGSMHPATLAEQIRRGSRLDPADRKYGWPHKFYADSPWGKFYTEHLKDATPEDREVIERAMGLRIEFKDKTVSWRAYRSPDVPS